MGLLRLWVAGSVAVAGLAAGADDGAPFVMLRSYGAYEDNKAFTERVFAAQERHPGLIEEIWFGGCGDPFSTPDEMGRVAAKGNLAVRERCRRLGIRFSYQDGVTLNHGPDGVRHAGIPEDAWAVDRAGKPVYGVFCCTSPFVKDFCREKAKAILSALRPASFWPDDDLRLSKVGKAPAICFCNRCLGLFGARVGRSFDREGLLTELTGPAASAETRRAWCAFNGEALGEFAQVYREAADAVSPETFVGQQLTVSSAAVNGDSWRRILETYGADGRVTGVRPGGGYYSDEAPGGLLRKATSAARDAAQVAKLPYVKQVCYEAETWPHIGSLKSPGGLMAECAYALASGCDSLALYWGADINGETDESYDFFFDTLAAWKPFLPKHLKEGNGFSAMGVYFALDLYAALDIPVGLVGVYRGNTRIEPWIPREAFTGLVGFEWCRDWRYVADKDWKSLADKVRIPYPSSQPSVLWNDMVAPWAPMAVRGVLWYQGCSNSTKSGKDEGDDYRRLMHALYDSWSVRFANPDLRLYFVQLAPFANWWDIQLAQARFAAEERNAAMVTTCDIGNLHDIHPNEKGTIGKRLAALALSRDYGFSDLVAEPPSVRTCESKGNQVVLAFDRAERWFLYNADWSVDVPFEIAGADGVWHRAALVNTNTGLTNTVPWKTQGRIDGRDLVLRADEVDEPKRIRYLHERPWAGFLYADSGLPLGPFEREVRP